jgi:hypothetical protein
VRYDVESDLAAYWFGIGNDTGLLALLLLLLLAISNDLSLRRLGTRTCRFGKAFMPKRGNEDAEQRIRRDLAFLPTAPRTSNPAAPSRFIGALAALYRSPLMPNPIRAALRRARRSPYMPLNWVKAWRLFKILNFEYGHLRSVATGTPLDAQLNPYAWYTYPALEYLEQLDFGTKTVFEYGCGHSTLFWARRAAHVVSVEHSREWFERVMVRLPKTCDLIFEPSSDEYAGTITLFSEPFDVIIIDGLVTGRTRLKCAKHAITCLRPGGMIILDNSDWLPESSRLLRESGLIEIDMTGFAPINDYTHTTSFYLHREFAFRPRHDRQPIAGVGSLRNEWERGAMEDRLAGKTP